jgi:hypothetical protein
LWWVKVGLLTSSGWSAGKFGGATSSKRSKLRENCMRSDALTATPVPRRCTASRQTSAREYERSREVTFVVAVERRRASGMLCPSRPYGHDAASFLSVQKLQRVKEVYGASEQQHTRCQLQTRRARVCSETERRRFSRPRPQQGFGRNFSFGQVCVGRGTRGCAVAN